MPTRPLSPHLSVYKLRYTLVTSILHRFTGVGLSCGLLLLVYWLTAVAAGADAQARAHALLSRPLMKLLYAALVAAYCYHLSAGVRHLIWDTGRGLERAQSQRSAWLIGIASVGLLLLIAWGAYLAGARTP